MFLTCAYFQARHNGTGGQPSPWLFSCNSPQLVLCRDLACFLCSTRPTCQLTIDAPACSIQSANHSVFLTGSTSLLYSLDLRFSCACHARVTPNSTSFLPIQRPNVCCFVSHVQSSVPAYSCYRRILVESCPVKALLSLPARGRLIHKVHKVLCGVLARICIKGFSRNAGFRSRSRSPAGEMAGARQRVVGRLAEDQKRQEHRKAEQQQPQKEGRTGRQHRQGLLLVELAPVQTATSAVERTGRA